MPTIFMHLQFALDVASTVSIDAKQNFGDYLLGHIAPDVISINNKKRTHTHFFSPTDPALRSLIPDEEMLKRYPQCLSPQSYGEYLFHAGTLMHLKADELWMKRIGFRFFQDIKENKPSNFEDVLLQRRIIHDVFRTLLDIEALTALPQKQIQALADANYQGWYPLANQEDIETWQDFIVQEIVHQTSEAPGIFAKRLGLSLQEFTAFLENQAWHEEHIDPICNKTVLHEYAAEAKNAMKLVFENYSQQVGANNIEKLYSS